MSTTLVSMAGLLFKLSMVRGCDIGEVENAVCDGQRRLRQKIGRSALVDCRDERQYRLLGDRLHVGDDFNQGFDLREPSLARGPRSTAAARGAPAGQRGGRQQSFLGEGNPSPFLFPHGRTRMMVFP